MSSMSFATRRSERGQREGEVDVDPRRLPSTDQKKVSACELSNEEEIRALAYEEEAESIRLTI